ARRTTSRTSRPAPSPACGGGVGRGQPKPAQLADIRHFRSSSRLAEQLRITARSMTHLRYFARPRAAPPSAGQPTHAPDAPPAVAHAPLSRCHPHTAFGTLDPRCQAGPSMSRPRHFSMLRDFHLADWFTLANAVCGTGAVFAAMRFLQDGVVRDLMIGMALIPLAF